MKKAIFIISAFGCMLFYSCESQNTNGSENTEADTTSHVESEGHDEHLADDNEKLGLNNGEKWVVNDEMRPHIAAQEEILKNYEASESKDYKGLAEQLKAQNSNLINSCTMEGESHDELHKWLHPHMELLDELGQAETNEEAAEVVSKIDESFKTFHQYFQ